MLRLQLVLGGCPPGPCNQPVPTQSLVDQWRWDGTVYSTSTCGNGVTCGAASCAAAGHYTAKMCAFPASADAGGPGTSACDVQTPTPRCVSVPFDWPLPSGSSVVGNY